MNFKQQTHIVFLDESRTVFHPPATKKRYSIILSPSLYWVKKVALPVKHLYEVKKLLPSIFEDILPQGHYSYSAYKEEDFYYIFAYEDKKIIDLLSEKNISMQDIAGVHFAQAEFGSLQSPTAISDTLALFNKDGLLITTPVQWFKSLSKLDLSQHKIISKPLTLQQYGHIVDHKSLIKIGAILVLLIAIVGIEIFITKQKIETLQTRKDELFNHYHLQSTMMQNRAVFSKYMGIYETQKKLRHFIGLFLKLPLYGDQTIKSITFEKGVLRVEIAGLTKKDEQRVMRQFKKEHIHYTIKYAKKTAIVEIVL